MKNAKYLFLGLIALLLLVPTVSFAGKLKPDKPDKSLVVKQLIDQSTDAIQTIVSPVVLADKAVSYQVSDTVNDYVFKDYNSKTFTNYLEKPIIDNAKSRVEKPPRRRANRYKSAYNKQQNTVLIKPYLFQSNKPFCRRE